jgi:predicted nucleotidyltransferase
MFRTDVLDAAIRQRRERLEEERKGLLDIVTRVVGAELPRLGVMEAYLVGSLAREGEWVEDSDVDIAITGGDPLAVMQVLEQATERNVDVIDLEAHPEPDMFRRRGMRLLG